MNDKQQFEQQLGFFSKAGLWYALPTTLVITTLLGFLAFSDPIRPVEMVLFLVMIAVDIFVLKVILNRNKK